MGNHVDGIDMEYTLDAWGDAPPLAGHTLFAEAATEKQRADLAGMTLATLCDMVLGEDAPDRSDDALVRAVGELERERDAANKRAATNHETTAKILAASKSKDKIIAGLNQKIISANARAEQAEADARALAERVFDTELLSDAEIEIVSRYLPREQMNGAGYKNEKTI